MLTGSCPAHTSTFADVSPQLVAVHLENELCVIYWSRSGCGIYLLKRQRRRSAELLPLRWWTHICTYLFIYLCTSSSQMWQKRGFVHSWARVSQHKWRRFLLSQMNSDVCLCVVSLREKMPFHHVTAGLLYKGNYLNRSLSDSDSDVLASISVEELAGEVSLCFYHCSSFERQSVGASLSRPTKPSPTHSSGGLSSQQHLLASPSTSLPNESISSSSTGSQSTWKYTSMDETLHCCLGNWLHNTR